MTHKPYEHVQIPAEGEAIKLNPDKSIDVPDCSYHSLYRG